MVAWSVEVIKERVEEGDVLAVYGSLPEDESSEVEFKVMLKRKGAAQLSFDRDHDEMLAKYRCLLLFNVLFFYSVTENVTVDKIRILACKSQP